MQRTMFEMGTTIRSLRKWDACIAACLGTMFIFISLLGLTIWLQVVALQFEIRTLRGRVECLERSHELNIELKAFSETEVYNKLRKFSGNKNLIYPLSEWVTFPNINEDDERNAAIQKDDSYKRNYIHIYKDRVKRDADSDNRKNVLPASEESQDSLFSWTPSENSPELDDIPEQHSSITSLASTASHKTSAGVPTEKKLLRSLRRNKDTRYRKKHNRTDISFASTTWKYPTSTEASIISRPSRVMKTSTGLLGSMILPPTFRSQPIYEESRASPTAMVRPFTRNRRRRPTQEVTSGSLETLDEGTVSRRRDRQLVAAHYHGDTSRYTSAHEHYDGNGRLRHPDGIFRDWTSASWMHTLGMNRHLSLSDHGVVNIRSSGLYFLYVQIYYVDTHDTNGFRLYVNSDAILQCTTHSSNADHSVKANTCFTASVAYLNINDNVSVSDVEGLRYSLFEPAKSFFGFFKVGDSKLR